MVAVRLYDTLIFREDVGLRLECNRSDLSVGPDNLVMRAARLLAERTGCTRGGLIRLRKRIPMAAGLAGGSTDAAATLVGLNKLWNLNLASAELARLGGELGSDVPFFFHTPAAWCTGRGEIVTTVACPQTLDLVLLCPSFGCSTAQVYQRLTVPAAPMSGQPIRRAFSSGAVEEIGRLLFNRLQPAAEQMAPALEDYHRRLRQLGPAGQLLSGSGSSLFALCRDRLEAERIAEDLRYGGDRDSAAQHEFTVFLVRSCS
jgi:4-diphosphocytidyl-2-C-methyl-D-erythritol kinase